MGVVIFPGLLISVIAYAVSIYYFIKGLRSRTFNFGSFWIGSVLSLILFAGVIGSWILAGKMYVFSPSFRIPLILFIIPFSIFYILRKDNPGVTTPLMKVLIISILLSGTCFLILGKYIFEFIEL